MSYGYEGMIHGDGVDGCGGVAGFE